MGKFIWKVLKKERERYRLTICILLLTTIFFFFSVQPPPIFFYSRTAVIHYVQNICPAVLPTRRYTLKIPAITTLYFKERDGLIKIYKQQDSWTLEGNKDTHIF